MGNELWDKLIANCQRLEENDIIPDCSVSKEEFSPSYLWDNMLLQTLNHMDNDIPSGEIPEEELCSHTESILLLSSLRPEPSIPTAAVSSEEFTYEPFHAKDWFAKKETPPNPPDISGGLGKRQDKKDLVALADFITHQEKLWVYDSCIYHYTAPCWQLLTERDAIILIRKTLGQHRLETALTNKEYRDIYFLLRDNPELQKRTEFCPPLHQLNLRDGTLDLETMRLHNHSRGDEFLTYLDFTYAEIQQAPYGETFENFVQSISNGDLQIRQQLLELVALAITGYEIKVFYALLGPSNTGKTQFGRFLQELIGRNEVECIAGVHDFANRFTTSQLEGKRLAMCLDLPDTPLPNVAIGTIKQLVGDDPIKVEAKYKNGRTIYRKPLLLFAGNHPIRIPKAKNEEAFSNRMVIIPFHNPVSASKQRQQLYQQLLNEAPYIVGQAIKAYRELQNRNFNVTRVEIPPEYELQDARPSFAAVKGFVSQCCTIDPNACCTTDALYQGYLSYADEENAPAINKTEFSRLFSELMTLHYKDEVQAVKRVNSTEQRGYQGIELCYL